MINEVIIIMSLIVLFVAFLSYLIYTYKEGG
jgi:hypothetical protein